MFCLQQSKKSLINSNTSPATSAKSLLSLSIVPAIFSPIYEMIKEDRLSPRNSVQVSGEEALKAVAQMKVYQMLCIPNTPIVPYLFFSCSSSKMLTRLPMGPTVQREEAKRPCPTPERAQLHRRQPVPKTKSEASTWSPVT